MSDHEDRGPDASNEPPAEPEPKGSHKPDGADSPVAFVQDERAPQAPSGSCPIVGIGASAGGLEALEALTSRLKADGMAFVVLQHLAAGHEAALTDILARSAPIRTTTITDGMAIEKNVIYVSPSNVDLVIAGGAFRLLPPADQRAPRHSIDVFFRSLAEDRGSGSIAVILSGAGTDGTLGLKAIKEEGGITFVQEPSTASQSSMPQSAIDAGCADFVLGPGEIGAELMRINKDPYVAASRARHFEDETRAKLFVMLRGAFGVDFSAYKQSTIERRVQRRMALHKIESLEDYLKYVQANVAELNVLYSDLLIGVTAFFRDKDPFETLRTTVFPRIIDKRDAEVPIRIWVPGCSTGEEPYSIAISLLEYLGDKAPAYKIQIFATDIDEHALARARNATYPQSIEIDVSPERLHRFFTPAEKGYQLKRSVRDVVVFARHNLGKDPPFSRIDLVSCRNALIYMQQALQRKVLHIFHYALQPEGFLLLGTSESVGDTSELFTLVDRKTKIYTRKGGPSAAVFDFALGAVVPDAPRERIPEARLGVNVLQLADRKILEKYGPPGVVVNEKLDIIQFRGRTSRFLEPTPGIASLNVLKQVRPELIGELRPAMERALAENISITCQPVRLWNEAEPIRVVLDIIPLATIDQGRSLIILFSEQRVTAPEAPSDDEKPASPAHVEALERELAATKEYLQATIEELGSANEELQASNEELQSSNEELQSTNEELETSKEELQSTNEELATLNEELQNRMAQLAVSNDDLQNIMLHISSTVVLVGIDLRIRSFSAAAERFLSLVPADVGRPIAYLRTVLKARDLENTVSAVINTTSPREQPVRGADGLWYTMRIAPHRTSDHTIRGAILELVKAPLNEKAEDEIARLARGVLASLPHAVGIIDEKLCVVWANKAFLALFDTGPDIFGRAFEDIWMGKVDEPSLWTLIEDAAVHGQTFKNVSSEKPVAGLAAMLFSTYALIPDGSKRGVVLFIEPLRDDGIGQPPPPHA